VSGAEAPLSLGIDAVDVQRFRSVLARRPTLVERLFTANERLTSEGNTRSVESLAARFAAKEATMKVLGVGIGGLSFHSIEVTSAASGAPEIQLTGKAEALAKSEGLFPLSCSLTHTKHVAMAIVGSGVR